jgi:hypothetical protein
MIRAALVSLAIVASPAMAEDRPIIFQHSDAQGNRFTMWAGACAEGPIEFVFQGHAYNVAAGQYWPEGCAFPKAKRRK